MSAAAPALSEAPSPSLFSRIDDLLNPIVVKELRQAVKSRIVVVILMGFLGIQMFVMGGFLWARSAQAEYGQGLWNAGIEVFTVLQWVLLPTLMLVIPAHATVRFANERSDQNVDLLFISALRPSSIVWGKFFAAIVLAMLVLSLVAPFMVFSYLMRGLDIPTILIILGIDLLAMVGATMAGLFLAAIPGPRPVKFIFALMGFLGLFNLFIGVGALCQELLRGMWFELADPERRWLILGTFAAGILAATSLLYFYTVALISPPSCDRIRPVRLCVLAIWLLGGIGAFFAYSQMSSLAGGGVVPALAALFPVAIWLIASTAMLCLQMVISICERESWGVRMAKAIPGNPLLRVVAFLLYTGAAGGVLFTLILMMATLGATWALIASLPGAREMDMLGQLANGCAGAMAYAVCYCLSALLLRHYFLAAHIKQGLTWILALVLAGLGSCIPALIAALVFPDSLRHGQDSGWWYLPNPFWVPMVLGHAEHIGGDRGIFELMVGWFLATWGIILGILGVPYIVQQALKFRPYRKKHEPVAPQAA
jgi:ABC-type transport system involved in multi-copper enzyme maturation permease subunit